MKAVKMQDERVLALRKRAESEAYYLLCGCLCVSLVVQFFFLRAPFAQYAAELLCLLVASVYEAVRNITTGAAAQPGRVQASAKRYALTSVGTGALSVLGLVVLAGETRPLVLGTVFLATSALLLAVMLLQHAANNRRLRAMDAALDSDDV